MTKALKRIPEGPCDGEKTQSQNKENKTQVSLFPFPPNSKVQCLPQPPKKATFAPHETIEIRRPKYLWRSMSTVQNPSLAYRMEHHLTLGPKLMYLPESRPWLPNSTGKKERDATRIHVSETIPQHHMFITCPASQHRKTELEDQDEKKPGKKLVMTKDNFPAPINKKRRKPDMFRKHINRANQRKNQT